MLVIRSAFIVFLVCASIRQGRALGPEVEFFENKIRPLLVAHCYECHSSETKRKGGLLLDSRSGWEIGGDNGPAVVPGDPEASLLFKAVSYLEPDLEMPPKKRLDPAQIADLRRWVAMGAPDPREGVVPVVPSGSQIDIAARKAAHWAWQPVRDPGIPHTSNTRWSRTESDRFVLKLLEEANLAPAESADPSTLIRRLYLDLIGLPPSPEAVARFVESFSEETYTRTVDELLGHPQFGERWAQHWLDLVRFAETHGHEQDFPIPEAWRYRDYVVRALNADVPYDQFVKEHVAGDLMDPPRLDPHDRTNESIKGTGFWHLGEATHSPVDIREDECTRVANQIDVFSKAFLGVTLACARCHDHKFDAISTRDYYAMFGFLQSSNYQIADASDPERQQAVQDDLEMLRHAILPDLRRELAAAVPSEYSAPAEPVAVDNPLFPMTVLPAESDFETVRTAIRDQWREALHRNAEARAAQVVVRSVKRGELDYVDETRAWDPKRDVIVDYRTDSPDAVWITSGRRFGAGPAAPGEWLLGATSDKPIRRIVDEPVAASDRLSSRFTGLLRTPTFEVTGNTVWMRFQGKAKLFVAVDSHRVCQGPLHSGGLRKNLVGEGEGFHWASHDLRKYIGHRIHLEFSPEEAFVIQEIRFSGSKPIDPLRINPEIEALVASPEIRSVSGYGRALAQLVRRSLTSSPGTPAQWALADWAVQSVRVTPEAARVMNDYLERKGQIEKRLPDPVPVLALMDGSAENEPVHIRGNYRTTTQQPVPRAFFEVLGGNRIAPPDSKGSGRLSLAEQMVDPSNPLTARVYVNRIWHHLFGRGLVETVDNFGASGSAPSHPELLDHLASRFVRNGWSLKTLVRELVCSSTYRASSFPDPIAEQIDPANRLFHRMPVRRLAAEVIRDSMLAVSGRLQPRSEGPSVMVHISEFMRSNRSPSGSGPLDGDGRRSLYVEERRNHLDPLLAAFDKPTPFTSIGRRNVSNSPAQPLIMLNNELVHLLARRWAHHLVSLPLTSDRERLELAYLSAFARRPEAWETELGLGFIGEQLAGAPASASAREQAWTDLAHMLFNVKEFLFIN
jgi:hypothetical protein